MFTITKRLDLRFTNYQSIFTQTVTHPQQHSGNNAEQMKRKLLKIHPAMSVKVPLQLGLLKGACLYLQITQWSGFKTQNWRGSSTDTAECICSKAYDLYVTAVTSVSQCISYSSSDLGFGFGFSLGFVLHFWSKWVMLLTCDNILQNLIHSVYLCLSIVFFNE